MFNEEVFEYDKKYKFSIEKFKEMEEDFEEHLVWASTIADKTFTFKGGAEETVVELDGKKQNGEPVKYEVHRIWCEEVK